MSQKERGIRRVVVNQQGMATTEIQGAMQVWNAFVGWFVAFTIPKALRHSSRESCPGISAHRTTSTAVGGKLHDRDGSRSVLGDTRNPKLDDDWSSTLWWALKLDVSHSLCSKELKRALFAEDNKDAEPTPETDHTIPDTGHTTRDNLVEKSSVSEPKVSDNGTEKTDPPWIVRGIPERPLYREVAKRLLEWNQRCFSQRDSKLILVDANQSNVTVSANVLGFEEIPFSDGSIFFPNLPPYSRKDIRKWLFSSREGESNADATIYKILGIRNTVGSLIPCEKRLFGLPSKKILLEAAGVFHKPKSSARQRQQQCMTVAAKARSKHAPRAIQDASFFGVARGPVTIQNQQAEELVERLLVNCVWINCHVFGGLTKTKKDKNKDDNELFTSWVVEIRLEEGYGARWRVEEYANSDANENDKKGPTKASNSQRLVVTFRGFLEPQMEDGHERRWRH